MRKAQKDFDTPPAILLNETRMGYLRTAVANGNARHISSVHYGPAEVKTLLEDIYHEKCAYCESTVKQVASLQVEHYRPKNGVSDDETHPGYFWLSVEWSNLVLGCPSCNGQGAKGNRFPVSGNRVMMQTPFDGNGNFDQQCLRADQPPHSEEMPLLLHPEIDEPGKHLKFSAMGQIEGISDRGAKTIEVCKLDRDHLLRERQKIINRLLTECKIVFYGKVVHGLSDAVVDTFLIEHLKEAKKHRDNPKAPYTSFATYLLDHPEECITPRIEPLFRSDFRRAFEQFKNQELI